MKQILVAVVVIVGLSVVLFGGSLPTSFHQVKTGTYKLELGTSGVAGRVFGGFTGK